jgi:hypothetical protein
MFQYVNEVFDKIEKATGPEKEQLLRHWGALHPYNMLLSLNFNDNVALDVPEGMPGFNVYKRDEATHPDLFQTTLAQQIKRLKSIIKGKNNLPKAKREHIFIQVLEGISPKEADVLVFAKDKQLTELYPSITFEFVQKVFPNYCFKKE